MVDLYSLVMECSVFDPWLVLSGFNQCHGVGAYEALRSERTGSFVGRNSVVHIVTGRRMNRGSIPRRNKRFVLSLKRPHLLRGLPSLLFSGYRG